MLKSIKRLWVEQKEKTKNESVFQEKSGFVVHFLDGKTD